MKKWLQNLGVKLQRSMYGRYGNDELGKFLMVTAIVLVFVSLIEPLRFMYFIALALMIWATFRCYSRNITKRRAELNRYLKLAEKPKLWIRQRKRMWNDRKTHCYIKCRDCKMYLRVPKGKGRIKVNCPKCGKEFIKKT